MTERPTEERWRYGPEKERLGALRHAIDAAPARPLVGIVGDASLRVAIWATRRLTERGLLPAAKKREHFYFGRAHPSLLPCTPTRRASPEDMRSRSPSTFMAAALTSSTLPITRFPPIQPKSEARPAPLASTITKEIRAKPSPTIPRAASSEGRPGIS